MTTPDMWTLIGKVTGADDRPVAIWQHGSDVILGAGDVVMCLPVKLDAAARKDFQLLFGEAERRAEAWEDPAPPEPADGELDGQASIFDELESAS
jgi:hypothetical protein